MIFVTVGSQLPFDRLIQTVDNWAANNQAHPVFAQIGISNYSPKHIDFCQTMSPDIYQDYLEKADLIISHVGMGTIISVLELGKPLLLMPRLANRIECRSAHQFATAKYVAHFPNITVANNEAELTDILKQLPEKITVYNKLETSVAPTLINAIKNFIKTID